MWFTQVSLRNPVFATMVMLAFVVLGAFSLQRLQVDQFPNIDFPVVVVTTTYPGASPEIVESEVTKKVEEAVNAIAERDFAPRLQQSFEIRYAPAEALRVPELREREPPGTFTLLVDDGLTPDAEPLVARATGAMRSALSIAPSLMLSPKASRTPSTSRS